MRLAGSAVGPLALLLALLTSCTGSGTSVAPAPDVIEHGTPDAAVDGTEQEPRPPVPVDAREREMDAILRALATHPEVQVRITVGTEYFGAGQFTLAVAGDGKVGVTQRTSGQVKTYDKTLAPDAVTAFGTLMADNRLAAARTSSLPRQPGDTPVKIEIARGDAPAFEVSIWDGDRFDDPQLMAILKETERLLQDVSGIPPF